MFHRRRHKLSALIALCAVLFSALLPASSALARASVFANDAQTMGVICTTHEANAPSAPTPPQAEHGHCALCVLAGSVALTPCAITVSARIVSSPGVPLQHAAGAPPRVNVALHPLIPRAPPRVN